MTRSLSWIGWTATGCALLAALIVIHALTRPHHHRLPVMALHSGATFASLDSGGASGLVVTSLQTGGVGEAAGLRVGDQVEDVDGLPAPTIDAFNADIASGSYAVVDLRVRRGASLLDIQMKRTPGG